MSPDQTAQFSAGGPSGAHTPQPGAPASPFPWALQEIVRTAEEKTSLQDFRRNIDLLKDVTLRVKVELGRGKMFLRDVLRLTEGSVVELDKMAGDPVEIYANDRLVGRGEVLILNENFCVRVTQIYSPEECLRIRGGS